MCNLLPFILFLFLSCKGDNNDSIQIAQGNDAIEDPDDCSNCLWKEEFEGPEINLNNWNFQLGYGDWEGANGWGNDEWQEYTDQNASIIDGSLVITAKNPSGTLGKRDGSITSSRMTTEGKYEFGPGTRIVAKIKAPWGLGIWPAFWALGSNHRDVGWPECGEIDIFEMIGGNPLSNQNNRKNHSTHHWKDNGNHASYGNSIDFYEPLSSDYHIYELIWDNDYMETKLDGISFHKIDITPDNVFNTFHKSFYIILNVAVGGHWPGAPNYQTEFPQKMFVDYIRVYPL